MRILALCKRHPQGRDLFLQPYGRFYHLSRLLADSGHAVELKLLSYGSQPPATLDDQGLRISSHPALPWGGVSYYRAVTAAARAQRPDWIIGFSDIWFGLLAVHLARRFGARALIDAYDNFETYHPMIPPLPQLWRGALRRADAVTAAGPQLAQLMRDSADGRPVAVVPMAADPCFFPRDRDSCRRQLGLPLDATLLGYTGAVDAKRGIETLFAVHAALKEEYPRMRLVMTGRKSSEIKLPADVIWLGYRPPEDIPVLLNGLDLVFVINKGSDFGSYSYPSKLYEAMRCRIPVVASKVPATAWVLRRHPRFLAEPGDVASFVEVVRQTIGLGRHDYGEDRDWSTSAQALEQSLLT